MEKKTMTAKEMAKLLWRKPLFIVTTLFVVPTIFGGLVWLIPILTDTTPDFAFLHNVLLINVLLGVISYLGIPLLTMYSYSEERIAKFKHEAFKPLAGFCGTLFVLYTLVCFVSIYIGLS